MAKLLKDVTWGRKYPMRIENEYLYLIRKNWGYRLIYEVFLKETEESLGTCIVKERTNESIPRCRSKKSCKKCKCRNMKFVVKELVSKNSKLQELLDEIQDLIYESF